MNRDTRKRPDGVNEMLFDLSHSEAEEWEKYFPRPTPAGHHLTYRWEGGQRQALILAVEPKPDAESKATAADLQILSALSEPEVQTKAAEAGIETKGKKKGQLVRELQEKGK